MATKTTKTPAKPAGAGAAAPKTGKVVLLQAIDGLGARGAIVDLGADAAAGRDLQAGTHYRKATKHDLAVAGLA